MSNSDDKVKIRLHKNGPMEIKGLFELMGRDGKEIIIDKKMKLLGVNICRCGKSLNLPFCDGSHSK